MNTVVNEISKLLGADHVIAAAAALAAPYREKIERIRRTVSYDKEAREIIAVATPGSTEELQGILKLVDGKPVKLWTMPNAGGLGATPPPESGDIVMLDLKRMNRILEVNAPSAYALVEPGVTYAQMQKYLADNNIPFWVDVDKNSSHSIADSIGAREFGYTPYGDHLLMQCGMEVLLANGTLVRTGMGAMPGSNTWQLFKYGYGPYVDGLFTQSNLGIITKIGLWLMPAPPVYKPFTIQLVDAEALAATVDALHFLRVNMLIPNTIVISDARQEAINSGAEPIDTQLAAPDLASKYQIGTWNVYGALYGVQGNVDVVWGALQGAIDPIPGAELKTAADMGDNPIWRGREQAMRGQVSASPASSDFGQVRLALGAAIEGGDATGLSNAVQAIADKQGMTAFTEFALTWRTMLARVSVAYQQNDADSLEKARECARAILAELAQQGYGATHADSDILLEATASFTHAGINDLQQRVKSALDPNAVFG